jgi:hypothetical protein
MSNLIRAAVILGIFVAAGGSPASAALDKDSFKCQNTLAKQGRKLFVKTFRALATCENKITKGTFDVIDCTQEGSTIAKIDYAEGKFNDKVLASCTDAIVANLDFGGACLGVTTEAGLVQCAGAEHKDAARRLIGILYPRNICVGGGRSGDGCASDTDCLGGGTCTPVNSLEDRDQRKCQKLLANTVIREASKRIIALQKCKRFVAKDKLPPDTSCVSNAQAKLSDILTLSRTKVAQACPAGLASPQAVAGACAGESQVENLQACALCSGDQEADDLIHVQYGSGAHGASAVAKKITDTADCVGGPLSRCRTNDYLLANDKIRVVIQDVQRNLFGIGQFGGQIIDADLVRADGDPDRDNFEEWSLSINIENTAHYTSLTIINDGSNGGAAIIRAEGVDDLLDFLNPSSVIAGFGFLLPSDADDKDLPVTVRTDYILEPGKNYVRVETTVQNTDTNGFNIFFGEFFNGSGQVEIFQPAYGFGEPLVSSGCPTVPSPVNACFTNESTRNFVAWGGIDEAAGVSYGYIHRVPLTTTFTTAGVTVPQLGVEVVLALVGAAGPPFKLEPKNTPGDSLTFTRYFVVGETVSSVTDTRNQIQCKPTGTVRGTVTAGGSPAAGADVSILGDLATAPNGFAYNVVTHTLTDDQGNYSLTLVPGDYRVVVNLDGYPYDSGTPAPTEHPVTVTAFGDVVQNVALPATGSLQVLVKDQDNLDGPAKVSVVGFDPSPELVNTQTVLIINNRTGVFGDFEDERPHGIAHTVFVGPDGDSGVVPLEPGDYQVVVSRGIEYSTHTENVTISAAPAPATVVMAKVEHVIDTAGFIGADFHVHSIHSPDSAVKMTDRVLTMLGEGVDFFTPSEHDIRVDYQPVIDALGASSLLGTAPSSEITTFDYGHFNAWPMEVDPNQVNGGSVDHGGAAPPGEDFPSLGNYSLTPAEIIAAAHADPGTNTVQINHIHSHFGLDGGSGLAINTGVEPPQSAVPAAARRLDPSVTNYFSNLPSSPADEKFDALEIWIGDSRGQIFNNLLGAVPTGRGGNIGDWFNMINQGILSTGIADSDTHNRLLNVAGIPRSMVASPTDDPGLLSSIAEVLSANVNAGRVVGTNGPMVRVTVTADSTGEVAGLELGMPTLIVTTNGEVEIEVDIQSPTWAPFDRVEYYVNTTTTRRTFTFQQTGAGFITVRRYSVTPDYVQNVTPSVVPVTGTADRLEASTSLTLSGLTEDIWVVVLVKGTDGVSEPLFPVVPNDLRARACSNDPCQACTTDANCAGSNTCSVTNLTLAELTDGNLNQCGIPALAFTNPLFVDVDGGGWSPPGVQVNIP